MDYALTREGNVVIWEINSNPFLVTDALMPTTGRKALAERFISAFNDALRDAYHAPPIVNTKPVDNPIYGHGECVKANTGALHLGRFHNFCPMRQAPRRSSLEFWMH